MSDRPLRWLTADEAAAYLRLSVEGFRRKVRAGIVPRPSMALGSGAPRWDIAKLDETMGGGAASMDPDEAAEAIAQKIIARGRAGRQAQAR